jgi:hypothetical protein
MAQAPIQFTSQGLEEVKPVYQPQVYGYSQAGGAPITSSQYLGSVPVPAASQ